MRTAAVTILLAAVLAAGCAGDGNGNEASPAPTDSASEPVAIDAGRDDPEPGRVLLAFVKAAGDNDPEAMWELLSEPTQASIGPTLSEFRAGAAQEFAEGLGTLAGNAKVILSRTLRDDWRVAAVAGERMVEGEPEYFAYGAALLPENGELKLELGGVVVTGFRPEPLQEVADQRPQVAANVGAGGDLTDVRMWLDGDGFSFRRGANDTPFTATMRGRPTGDLTTGRHEIVVFAATDQTATATAWTFSVKG